MQIDRERVRRLMLKQGIQTFTELATHLGVSKQTLSAWFGGGPFSSVNLNKLCQVLDCTPNDVLVFGEEVPNGEAPVLEPEFA